MEWTNEKTIILTILLLMVASFFIVLIFYVFNKRKNVLIEEKEKVKEKLEKEIAETQIEIREETLRNISWELHDNIGQLITLAKIQVQNAHREPDRITENLQEATGVIGNALNELRSLSKSINPESLKEMGFIESLEREIQRFDRMRFIHAELNISGEEFIIPQKEEIILFRILQEFFSNTIKHSRASQLFVDVDFDSNSNILSIIARDNGVGFDTKNTYAGIGIKNMRKRAELIGASLEIVSEKNKGTQLIIKKKKT